MATRIALVGAGGKMGCRITDNFVKGSYAVEYLEVSPKGLENLRARGVRVSEADTTLPAADVVILAVPDVLMGEIAGTVVPRMKPGALLMTLDPAAPLDGQVPPATTWAASSRIPAIPRCSTGSRQSRRSGISTAASRPSSRSSAR